MLEYPAPTELTVKNQDAPQQQDGPQLLDALPQPGGLLQQLPWFHKLLPNQSNVVQNFKSIIFGSKNLIISFISLLTDGSLKNPGWCSLLNQNFWYRLYLQILSTKNVVTLFSGSFAITKHFQRLGFHQVNGKASCPTEGNWWIFQEGTKSLKSFEVSYKRAVWSLIDSEFLCCCPLKINLGVELYWYQEKHLWSTKSWKMPQKFVQGCSP